MRTLPVAGPVHLAIATKLLPPASLVAVEQARLADVATWLTLKREVSHPLERSEGAHA